MTKPQVSDEKWQNDCRFSKQREHPKTVNNKVGDDKSSDRSEKRLAQCRILRVTSIHVLETVRDTLALRKRRNNKRASFLLIAYVRHGWGQPGEEHKAKQPCIVYWWSVFAKRSNKGGCYAEKLTLCDILLELNSSHQISSSSFLL